MRLVGFISVWKRAGLEKGKGGVGESAKGRRKGYIVILLLRLLIRLLNREARLSCGKNEKGGKKMALGIFGT